MTKAAKAAMVLVAGAAVVAAVLFLRGASESEPGRPDSRGPEKGSQTRGTEGRSSGSHKAPLLSGPVSAGANTGTVGVGPDAAEVPAPPPRPPLAKPSASEAAHRRALSEPRNPERWLDYAKALDAEGKPDLALAALRRALHLGVDFEGRREVMRLVREYEEYLGKSDREAPADRRARNTTPKPSRTNYSRTK